MQKHLTPEQARKALKDTVAIVKSRAASALPPSEPQGKGWEKRAPGPTEEEYRDADRMGIRYDID